MAPKTCDPNCNQDVGCVSLQSIREELSEHNIDQARSSARLDVAAQRAEGMIDALEKCLESIQDHTLTLNDGRHEFQRLNGDITAVAKAGRDHSQSLEGDHPTHRSIEKDMNDKFGRVWAAQGGMLLSVAILYLVIWVSPIGDFLVEALKKKFLG